MVLEKAPANATSAVDDPVDLLGHALYAMVLEPSSNAACAVEPVRVLKNAFPAREVGR
jgi:hypothetical protein